MKKIFTITFFVAVAMMAFVSCGGEGPDGPVDTDPVDDTVIVDDNEPVDNDIESVDDTTDSEPTDDLTEETPDDDGLIDEESDEDSTPVRCAQDEICKEKCKEVILLDGELTIRKPQAAAGKKVKTRLYVNDEDRCAQEVSGEFTFTSIGETFPTEWAWDQTAGNFFSFQGIKENIITLNGSDGSENYPVTVVFELEKTN